VAGLHLGVIIGGPWLGNAGLVGSALVDVAPFCQLMLMLAWVALGPGPLVARIGGLPVLLAVGSACWYWMWGWGPLSGTNVSNYAVLVRVGAVAAVGFLATRICGVRVALSGRDSSSASVQFSLRSLLVLTTVIGAVIGLLEWLRPALSDTLELPSDASYAVVVETLGSRQDLRLVVGAIAVTMAGLAGIWAALRPGTPWLRVVIVCVGAAAVGAYETHLDGGADNDFFAMAASVAAALGSLALLIGVSVMPLRLLGYRLARYGREIVPQRSADGTSVAVQARQEPRCSAVAGEGLGPRGETLGTRIGIEVVQ
jgi:hypothetical protein